MFRLGKSDSNARKGSADMDNLDGIENTEKLYVTMAKRSSGWSADLSKENSPKTSAAPQPMSRLSGKSSVVDPALSDDEHDDMNDIDDYVADMSDVTSSQNLRNKILHEVIQESDPRVNFSSLFVVDDIDLSILTKHLHPCEDILEDESQVYTWETLFTKVALELRSEGRYK